MSTRLSGASYPAWHHTEAPGTFARERTRSPSGRSEYRVTYHDPCYLARYNEVLGPAATNSGLLLAASWSRWTTRQGTPSAAAPAAAGSGWRTAHLSAVARTESKRRSSRGRPVRRRLPEGHDNVLRRSEDGGGRRPARRAGHRLFARGGHRQAGRAWHGGGHGVKVAGRKPGPGRRDDDERCQQLQHSRGPLLHRRQARLGADARVTS